MDPETRSLWVQICDLCTNDDVISTLKICSTHFVPEDYIDYNAKHFGGFLRLKLGAVPSI